MNPREREALPQSTAVMIPRKGIALDMLAPCSIIGWES